MSQRLSSCPVDKVKIAAHANPNYSETSRLVFTSTEILRLQKEVLIFTVLYKVLLRFQKEPLKFFPYQK